MAPHRSYELSAPILSEIDAALTHLPPLVRTLLALRGIADAASAETFLNPNYDEHLHDPFLFTDMGKAVERIFAAIDNNEHIAIYTDYDCDGIPGGVILHDLFESIGYTNFENYIPHRHYEGYGFNALSVDVLHERGTKLIITVDCGIVDFEAAARARECGIDVIITDHHEPSDALPDVYAIINPKADAQYPFQGICGAGVAYKLALGLLTRGRERGRITLKEGMEKWWLDMVGLATIADMVPLRDENRVLARYGLSVLRKSRRPGIQQLLRKAGGDQRFLTEEDIGFTIAPRINAASRMDTPEDAFHMLRTKDEGEAGEYVAHLERLNNERKGVVAGMTKEVKKRLHTLETVPPVIVMGNPEWRPSLVGLVASSVAEEYGRPTFFWGRDGRGVIKGSCRSGGTGSVVVLMESVREAFITFGGHHASGGFAVHNDTIHTLSDTLIDAQTRMWNGVDAEKEVVLIDAELSLDQIDGMLLRALASLAPFGEGNPKPIFRFTNVSPERIDIFGKTKNHTKLMFRTTRGHINGIAFFKLPNQFHVIPEVGKQISLIAHVEESIFMGRKEVRLRIVDTV